MLSSPPEQSPDRIERALFSPRSILLCGASRDPGRIGGKVLERLRKSFSGRVEILSQHELVQGARTRPTIEGMEPVDVAIVTLQAPDATAVVEELAQARATRAIILSSSGFADAGATELQARVVEACDRANVLLVGPNALGTFSAGSGFVSTFATQLDRPRAFPLPDGDVAVVSESGAVAAFIHAGLQDAGIGVRHWAALGNAARTSVAEVLRWYARDDAIKSVIVYVEAASDLVALTASISSSSDAGQRVIFLTSGESEIGRRAASSHTGRMASNCHVLRQLARAAGATIALSISHAIDMTKVRRIDETSGRGWAIGTVSGGAGVEAVDHAARIGLPIAELADDTQTKLRATLPVFAAVANPVDVTAQIVNDPDLVARATRVLQDAPEVSGVLWVLGLQEQSGDAIAREIVRSHARDSRLAVAWLSPPASAVQILQDHGVPVFDSISRMLEAVNAVSGTGAVAEQVHGPLPDPTMVPEDLAKEWLAEAGLKTPEQEPILDGGTEAVLKAAGPYILHKRQLGLMAGPVTTEDERDTLRAVIKRNVTHLGLEDAHVFSEAWAAPPSREWFVSVIAGEASPVVLIGTGGSNVEAVNDIVAVLPEQLESRGDSFGFRDPRHGSRVVQTLVDVFQKRGLSMLEINPLGEYEDGSLVCLDAVAQRPTSTDGELA